MFTTLNMGELSSQTEVYHILQDVGMGTFGDVVRCCRARDGALVAVKMIKQHQQRDRVFENELRIMGAVCLSDVSKSHIVQFFEAFRDGSQHCLVFELLEKDLSVLQAENDRPMAVRHIRVIACQMLKALQKLRELTIIHADLKPQNIMLVDHRRYPFRVKLIDFGSSSIYSEVRFVTGPYIQTRFYRSPEILLGLPFCERMDTWSLGCVLAELYLGRPLYPGNSEMEQVRYICETQGLPNQNLLSSASKTQLFFRWTKNSLGEYQWQLKKSGSAWGGEQGTRQIFSSLDGLAGLELTGHDAELRKEDATAEMVDRRSMVDLLKMMLTLDSQNRILPKSALHHSFISMAQLSSDPELIGYYEASALAMERADVCHKFLVRSPWHQHHLHQPTRTNESKEAPQTCPPRHLTSSQHEQCLQESGETADSQCASGSYSEMHVPAELEEEEERPFAEEEASTGACTQEDERYDLRLSRVRVGTSNLNSDPSSTREHASDCIFKPSGFTADTSDCIAKSPSSFHCLQSNATSESSTTIPLGPTVQTPIPSPGCPLYQPVAAQTSTYCSFHLPCVTFTSDYQPVQRLHYSAHPPHPSRSSPRQGPGPSTQGPSTQGPFTQDQPMSQVQPQPQSERDHAAQTECLNSDQEEYVPYGGEDWGCTAPSSLALLHQEYVPYGGEDWGCTAPSSPALLHQEYVPYGGEDWGCTAPSSPALLHQEYVPYGGEDWGCTAPSSLALLHQEYVPYGRDPPSQGFPPQFQPTPAAADQPAGSVPVLPPEEGREWEQMGD